MDSDVLIDALLVKYNDKNEYSVKESRAWDDKKIRPRDLVDVG